MIIKEADDKQSQLNTLKGLLTHPNADASKIKRIEQEVRNIQAGIRGEEESAYEMKVHYGESKNWMIIHDLRIEHNGLVAQIDHLIINRILEVWVCESKNFAEGISINEHGEFTAYYNGKSFGVQSPIEQNDKHILILKRVFDAGIVSLPKRLGFTIKPDLNSLVLVSKKAKIIRPKVKIIGLDVIVKNDQFRKSIEKHIDDNNPLVLAKLVGADTLLNFAKEIAKLHKPIEFNWLAKFGLNEASKESAPKEVIEQKIVVEEKKKLICMSCGVGIQFNVAKFCWNNKSKFGGNAYCVACQKNI